MRGRALALAASLAAIAAGPAAADVRVAAHQYQLGALEAWTELPAPERDDAGDARIVAGYRHADSDALVAITRVEVANPRAWRSDEGFFDEVEAGVESASARFERFHERQQRVGAVPALDLGFRRDTERGREVVLMRFLFFRRYTLALALRAPARSWRRHQRTFRALVESFTPYVEAP